MPIYAYRCESCGHEKDVLQKLSDPLLTQCPACGQESFRRKLTAPGFQLKGTGWYVTDFRDGNKSRGGKAPGAEGTGAEAAGQGGTNAESAGASGAGSGDAAGSGSGSGSGAVASDGGKAGGSAASGATGASAESA